MEKISAYVENHPVVRIWDAQPTFPQKCIAVTIYIVQTIFNIALSWMEFSGAVFGILLVILRALCLFLFNYVISPVLSRTFGIAVSKLQFSSLEGSFRVLNPIIGFVVSNWFWLSWVLGTIVLAYLLIILGTRIINPVAQWPPLDNLLNGATHWLQPLDREIWSWRGLILLGILWYFDIMTKVFNNDVGDYSYLATTYGVYVGLPLLFGSLWELGVKETVERFVAFIGALGLHQKWDFLFLDPSDDWLPRWTLINTSWRVKWTSICFLVAAIFIWKVIRFLVPRIPYAAVNFGLGNLIPVLRPPLQLVPPPVDPILHHLQGNIVGFFQRAFVLFLIYYNFSFGSVFGRALGVSWMVILFVLLHFAVLHMVYQYYNLGFTGIILVNFMIPIFPTITAFFNRLHNNVNITFGALYCEILLKVYVFSGLWSILANAVSKVGGVFKSDIGRVQIPFRDDATSDSEGVPSSYSQEVENKLTSELTIVEEEIETLSRQGRKSSEAAKEIKQTIDSITEELESINASKEKASRSRSSKYGKNDSESFYDFLVDVESRAFVSSKETKGIINSIRDKLESINASKDKASRSRSSKYGEKGSKSSNDFSTDAESKTDTEITGEATETAWKSNVQKHTQKISEFYDDLSTVVESTTEKTGWRKWLPQWPTKASESSDDFLTDIEGKHATELAKESTTEGKKRQPAADVSREATETGWLRSKFSEYLPDWKKSNAFSNDFLTKIESATEITEESPRVGKNTAPTTDAVGEETQWQKKKKLATSFFEEVTLKVREKKKKPAVDIEETTTRGGKQKKPTTSIADGATIKRGRKKEAITEIIGGSTEGEKKKKPAVDVVGQAKIKGGKKQEPATTISDEAARTSVWKESTTVSEKGWFGRKISKITNLFKKSNESFDFLTDIESESGTDAGESARTSVRKEPARDVIITKKGWRRSKSSDLTTTIESEPTTDAREVRRTSAKKKTKVKTIEDGVRTSIQSIIDISNIDLPEPDNSKYEELAKSAAEIVAVSTLTEKVTKAVTSALGVEKTVTSIGPVAKLGEVGHRVISSFHTSICVGNCGLSVASTAVGIGIIIILAWASQLVMQRLTRALPNATGIVQAILSWLPLQWTLAFYFAYHEATLGRYLMDSLWHSNWYIFLFIVFAAFKAIKIVVNAISYYLYTQTPLALNEIDESEYTPKDVTVILTTRRVDGNFVRSVHSIIATGVSGIIISTVGLAQQRAAVDATAHLVPRVLVISSLRANKREELARALLHVQTRFVALKKGELFFWPREIFNTSLAPFHDPFVGMVGTSRHVVHLNHLVTFRENLGNHLATVLVEQEQYEAIATSNIDGGVFNLNGPVRIIRSEILCSLPFRQAYLSDTWLGVGPLVTDSETFVTRWVKKLGYKVIFNPHADARRQVQNNRAYYTDDAAWRARVLKWYRCNYRHVFKTLFADRVTWRAHPWTTYASFLFFFDIPLFYDGTLFFLLWNADAGCGYIYGFLFALLIAELVRQLPVILWHGVDAVLNFFPGALAHYLSGFLKLYAFFTTGIDPADTGDYRLLLVGGNGGA